MNLGILWPKLFPALVVLMLFAAVYRLRPHGSLGRVAVVIAIIYFGVERSHPALGIALFAIVALVLLWTAPNRWGLGIALHYVSRAYAKDADDPIPPAMR